MIAVGTNVFAYVEGVGDVHRRHLASLLLRILNPDQVVVPVQVLGELHRVLKGKARRPAAEVDRTVRHWSGMYLMHPTRSEAFQQALDLASHHDLQIWDAVILAASADAGATVLLSEDMQHGFVWNGVTIVNPFAPAPYEELLTPYLLSDDDRP